MADTASRSRSDLRDWWRFWSEWLSLWSLCGNAACRRGRCCRGDATRCFPRNFQLLPEGVRDWFISLMAAKLAHLPFDYALGWLDGAGHGRALDKWNETVEESFTSPRARGEVARRSP